MGDVAEEEIEDGDGDERARDAVFFHLVDGVFDEDGLVGEELDRGAGRELGADVIRHRPAGDDLLGGGALFRGLGLGGDEGDAPGLFLRLGALFFGRGFIGFLFVGDRAFGVGVFSRGDGFRVEERTGGGAFFGRGNGGGFLAGFFAGNVGLLGGCAEEGMAHGLGDDEDVGIGLLENFDFNALAAVDAGDDVAVFVEARDGGDVAEADIDGVVGARDDEGADFLDGFKFVEGADDVFGLALAEVAAGHVDVAGREALADLGDVEAELGEFALVDGDEEFLFEAALDLHGGDTVEGFEPAFYIVLGDVAEFEE